jgi:septum formation protein
LSTPQIILASKSPARRKVLANAGVPLTWLDAGVDEEALKARARESGSDTATLALLLAEAKALALAGKSNPEDIVIGCDQLLVQDGKLFDKPRTMAEARAHLHAFSGCMHELVAAVCMVQDGRTVWSHVSRAGMCVRPLTDAFIDDYLEREGEQILSSVGAYLVEGGGAQLFERIDGDYFTVLGLPLLPLLEELRKRGILPA